jgi:nitrogen fixation NifU-like protein
MSLADLYREIILEHARHPQHKGPLDGPVTLQAGLDNPTCGDEVVVQVRLGPGGLVEAAKFDGVGCSISMAAASIMSEMLVGRTLAQVKELTESYTAMVSGQKAPTDDLQDLVAFAGVAQFPMRVKCAALPFHALQKGISRYEGGI